ncbi:hypothetical protein ACFL3D_06845 [Candidatus Omnitrophota bacterium]
MVIKDILSKCSTLSVYEERTMTDDYCELVFYRKDIDAWEKNIAEVMDGILKPAGTKPAREHLAITRDLGGLWSDQTLFSMSSDGDTFIAMFWPWQDKTHVTLKITAQRGKA